MSNTRELQRLRNELNEVQNAILDIQEGGQSVNIGDMNYTEVNINALYAREQTLKQRIARIDGSRPRVLGVSFSNFPR